MSSRWIVLYFVNIALYTYAQFDQLAWWHLCIWQFLCRRATFQTRLMFFFLQGNPWSHLTSSLLDDDDDDDVKKKRLVKQQQLGNKQLAESFHSETRKHQRVFLTEAVCLHLNTAYCTSLEWALVWSTVLHKSFNPNSLVWKLHVLCKNICFYCNKARTSPEKSHCHRQTRWPLSVFCLSRTAGRGK